MHPKISEILKQAGVTHGLLHDEAEIILVFSSPELFSAFCDSLKRAYENDKFTKEEYKRILSEAEGVHRKAMAAQKNYRATVLDIHKKCLKAFFHDRIRKLNQETQDFSELPGKIKQILKANEA